ncbi:hypothetical protein L6164_035876 [Bauhinia variegata]|uniref:Uncharacterized protein n=1 Tax=Bauhinia variegata TaxID=167791 RepID=A0ACB9KFB3_BAUVA|nr:hypothetical protein L6164_035876 [Bauhinia variegata]
MDGDEPSCPSPYVSSSSLLKDISNFRTPKRQFQAQNPTFQSPCQQFFTASKQTPYSSLFGRRPSIAPPSSARSRKSAVGAARKLKAFELEQSQSSRKAQIKKEQSLKSLAKSITVWLNFLFENPGLCGCDLSIAGVQIGNVDTTMSATKGKRDGGVGISVEVDVAWRTPKRLRNMGWQGEGSVGKGNAAMELPNSMLLCLSNSLKDVCSFDDLKQRMGVYLTLGSCKEIFEVMSQVTKNIDEGRLKLKSHCPIVTDVGLKDKATKILMCYNPIWLRIGLYIIFGGDSLLPNGNVDSQQEITFLKMVIEKQFFSHAGLAKAYAYNKMVEGVYRPGYYEKLGNVILKRILLLVLILDRVKSQSCLPLKYGIDGLDGGSPLLFEAKSWIKSSNQVIQEFLSSDVMHGEGNLLAHLVTVGYKVSHLQGPLVDYDFRVKDLFIDIQDGIRLCRAIQLLQHDSSILTKIIVPSDTRKKNLANCGLVMQYLKQAGVSLNDEDGLMIVADDVAHGDKELSLSLLWNMFVHLQLPLLVEKTSFVEEISKIRGLGLDLINANSMSLELLLNWIQAVCENYDCVIENFHSLVDGKAIWCLLDYYFQKELHDSCSLKEVNRINGKESIMSVNDYSDAVYNFILSQKLTTLLGNFPEVLQISDLLEYNGACSNRSVVILLVFLARQLFVKRNMDQLNFHKLLGCDCQSLQRKYLRIGQCLSSYEVAQKLDASDVHGNEEAARKFKAIQAWWQDMAERNNKLVVKPAISNLHRSGTSPCSIRIKRENSATVLQSHFRRLVIRRQFLKMMNAVSLLQAVFRAWLKVRQESDCVIFTTVQIQNCSCAMRKQSEVYRRYVIFFAHRHSFLRLKKSVKLIQQAVRNWISRTHQDECSLVPNMTSDPATAATTVQKFVRCWMTRSRYIHQLDQKEKASNLCQQDVKFDNRIKAAIKIQCAWKKYTCCKHTEKQNIFATKIQCNFRRWLLRKRFLNQIQAVMRIQCNFRMSRCVKNFKQYKIASKAVIVIQSFVRGQIAIKEACARRNGIVAIQRKFRGWLVRRNFLFQREAAIKIQSVIRSMKYQKALNRQKDAAVVIQRFVRGDLIRNKLLGAASRLRAAIPSGCSSKRYVGFCSFQLELFLISVLKLQRWWKGVLLLKLRTNSAIIIQSYARGRIARRKAIVYRHHIVVIQSHWKGYLARKESREQLQYLRLRVQKSARNVDDRKRIINRLLAALAELRNMKSLSGILHTCATLDMATEHSQKCCEELVAGGAIKILLTLIRSVSRSIPDQEVLKYCLSTLRNLARYPHLLEVLIESHGSVEIILWELLRNKEEGYFIASDLLKKISSTPKGIAAIYKSPALLKRLHALVEEQTKKANHEKRNARGPSTVARDNKERRLKEAAEILKLITGA